MPPQAMRGGGYYVFTTSRCPDVCLDVRANVDIFSLRTNTEQTAMKLAECNHYH